MLKYLVYTVNDLPFAGKLAIRPFAYRYWNATSNKDKVIWFLGLTFLLIFFIYNHFLQALGSFQNLSMEINPIFNIIFLTYGLVNLLVVIAQIHLMTRAVKVLPKKLPTKKRNYVGIDNSKAFFCVCVTLLGQIIYLFTLFLSRN